MRLSARVDYALRAAAELAAAGEGPTTVGELAKGQDMPPKYLENILLQMRRAGLVRGQRGPEGGYVLARPADKISLADVIRAVDGPLANVRGERPEHVGYTGAAEALQQVWIALRASERAILEEVTLEQIAKGELPARVTDLTADPSAWNSHTPV
ncbi:Rrf2 family transcriptional regulator [Microtetraspora sp. NBRC 16547]|uniref:RrF2 family transcriptional regulator n=1 Tax=Microtetraspora sp. NBRC 16547 TaxID=3030993 RepID=UPI0024A4A8C9|nr:Rrf2 family transcriptional regulator [Microtetraspora sp. NBRC 16547]GLW97989.1 Rrf2 family transcriptional regulator [Microtetraspora sp. NBRC 16547]